MKVAIGWTVLATLGALSRVQNVHPDSPALIRERDLRYAAMKYPQFGSAAAQVGDLDRDGTPDVTIFDPGFGPNSNERRFWTLSGKDLSTLISVEIASYPLVQFAALSDVNGDSRGDQVVLTGESDRRVTGYSGMDGRVLWSVSLDANPGALGLASSGSGALPRFVITSLDSGRARMTLHSSLDGKVVDEVLTRDECGSVAAAWSTHDTPELWIAIGSRRDPRVTVLQYRQVGSIPDKEWTVSTSKPVRSLDIQPWPSASKDQDSLLLAFPGTVEVRGVKGGELVRRMEGSTDDGFASRCVPISDLDGDGLADVLVGSPRWRKTGAGRVQAFGTKDGRVIWEANSPGTFAWGSVLCPIPDLDGDGHHDALVATVDDLSHEEGVILCVSGRSGRELRRIRRDGARVIVDQIEGK